jgi:hypothetical protein
VAALYEVRQVWARRLGVSDTHHVTEQAADARKVCELLGIDDPAIETEAAQDIPTPKSWELLTEKSGADTEPKASPTRTPPKATVRCGKAATLIPPRRSARKRNRSH